MELQSVFEKAVVAGRALNMTDEGTINDTLMALADLTEKEADRIVEANAKDLALMDKANPMYDRLLLNKERIYGIASDIRNVASLPSPLGCVLSEVTRPNGMVVKKVSVPFGVVGVIYEARPNVGFDVFSLCFKSGNSCILKGGSDARNSNEAIVELIKSVLREKGIDENSVTLMPASRESTAELLNAVGYVDLVLPRGSRGLIDFVRDNAKVPVIETGAGICHVYFDKDGDTDKGAAIVFNSKTRRVSVCNALDCLIIHSDRLKDLPAICGKLAEKDVVIYADAPAFEALKGFYPENLLFASDDSSYGTEFLSYKMSIKTVGSLQEALDHIARYSSKHSEAIISENAATIAVYERSVDAACVYANVATSFTDGAQFGLGAEIGISTQKLHARGPMGLHELTSYKYIVTGNGQTRD